MIGSGYPVVAEVGHVNGWEWIPREGLHKWSIGGNRPCKCLMYLQGNGLPPLARRLVERIQA